MPMGFEADALRLRRAIRGLVAVSTVPAVWAGREPRAIAAGLVDVLVNALHLDFAFVRLCDPTGGAAVEIARGSAWQAFPEWLQQYLSVNGRLSRREIVRERVWPFQPESRVLQSDNVDEFVAVPRIVADPSRS